MPIFLASKGTTTGEVINCSGVVLAEVVFIRSVTMPRSLSDDKNG